MQVTRFHKRSLKVEGFRLRIEGSQNYRCLGTGIDNRSGAPIQT